MSTELIPIPNNAVATFNVAPDFDPTGLSDVASLKPSNLILCQNTTRDMKTARPGQFLDSLTEEVYDSVTVVPLKVSKQRVLFPQGADLDAEPVCRSNDGIAPSQFAKAPQSLKCATCPHSRWVNDKKSACAEKLKLLVATKDTGLPRFFTAGGKSITTLRNVLQRVNETVKVNAANMAAGKKNADGSDLKALHLYDFHFKLGSEKVTGKYSYFVARFDNVLRVTNPGEFGPLFNDFVTQRQLQADEEAAAAAEAAVDATVSGAVEATFVSEV